MNYSVYVYITGMVKVRPIKDFLRPWSQTLCIHYQVYNHHFVRKHKKLTYYWLKRKKQAIFMWSGKLFFQNLARDQKILAIPVT
jgi:hypothetical protein